MINIEIRVRFVLRLFSGEEIKQGKDGERGAKGMPGGIKEKSTYHKVLMITRVFKRSSCFRVSICSLNAAGATFTSDLFIFD